MSAPTFDHKKRPPPIAIPPLLPSRPVPGPNAFANAPSHTKGSTQYLQRLASSPTQQAACSETTTPLTSPLEPDESRLAIPNSGSQTSKHRSSAMTTLTSLMEQARGSPRKSDCGSVPSRHGSTARSKQSEYSHRSATIAQAQLEALDEDGTTTRSQIESRTEKKLFKMTGQIPPTPTTGTIDPERVFIRTEDLRAQCRAASGEKKLESDEPSKSPKKKLFGVSLPTFSRTPANGVPPAMPSKAAQVLGTSPSRKSRRIQPRPIKSARVMKTPTKVPRSDTANSLPAKVYSQTNPTRTRYGGSTLRNRTTGRKSPGKENVQPQGQATVNLSFESMPPPTPPAKDTPPELRPPVNPPSPLRRAPSRENLRESYGELTDRGIQMQLQFPMFALSPLPPKTAIHGSIGTSPTKFRPYTAEDYTRLIEDGAKKWPYPEEDAADEVKTGGHSAPMATEGHDLPRLPHTGRWSDDNHYNERLGRRLSPLPPRFYSPSDRSVQLFKDGESPSQNTDTSRMLFAQPKPSLLQLREDSNNGSIEMVFQGSVNDIESDSSKTSATKVDPLTEDKQLQQQRDGSELAMRVMQELRMGDRHQPSPAKNGVPGLLQSDISSSKLTDMLNGASPRAKSNGDFRIQCPSAVPSPLNKLHGPYIAKQPMLRGGNGASPAGLWASPRTPKTIDDHFYMTNEHLDVVGKTTYDALDMYSKQQISTTNAKYDQLVVLMDKHIEGLKSQVSSVNEKADHTSDQTHNVSLQLDRFENFLKDEVLGAMMDQTKKTTAMETTLVEMQKAMTRLQQTVEKLSEVKPGPQYSATSTLPTSGATAVPPHAVPTHHSQPSLTSYYGQSGETGREEQPPMPPLQDRNMSDNYNSHSDPRGSHGNNWQPQAWNGRSTYQGRSKEERPSYSGTNPYHFGNGGQYNSAYMNGYPCYNFSPSTPEQPYTYGQKPAQ
ncbi:uncharacterized protein EKO05_0011468 [Ascochyta rabiei]|uniref:Uncharacterized protein n=1 Tax=Didymella rabiei TaxID=5454 RepID=A0A163ERR3_DIDRA|nr:uncharacterized protein EKO05_0011468 [Ascochyta rabiei]KZM23871.1 hypothetical protein ST47_g4990 [Ascochyta rabiei]UPX21277.1 hypothetical protein EKO05_0011468 [Ascochyta rabiei]